MEQRLVLICISEKSTHGAPELRVSTYGKINLYLYVYEKGSLPLVKVGQTIYSVSMKITTLREGALL